MRRALGLFAALFLAVSTPAAAQTRELVMGNVNPAKHGTTQAAQQFADKLGELTQGKIKVIHHHSGPSAANARSPSRSSSARST